MSVSSRPLTILHTGAHPADAFDMVGGTLAHHIQRGDRVTCVVFSHGVRSHALDVIEARRHNRQAAQLDQTVADKEREVIEGCRVLGIEDVRFLRYDDHMLLVKEEHITTLAKIIRQVRPDVIITHSPYEQHGITTAHRVCCDLTMLARSVAGGLMEGDDSPPHRVGEVFFMWQHGETTSLDYALPRFPAILIDVGDVVHLKVKAMDCLKSQFYPGGLARKVIEDANASHGVHMCVPYCEAFFRYYPEVHSHLPVCEHNLRIASEPLEKTYERLGRFIVPHVEQNGACATSASQPAHARG